jgi:uncharacterized protein (TIGR01777 family)
MGKIILITGGSGLLGTYLTSFFSHKGFTVRQLGRGNKGKEAQGLFYWNPEKNEIDAEALRGVDVLIHLAGETVAGKAWTADRKKRILDSRIQSTRLLLDTIQSSGFLPKKVLAASATGYYGAVTRDVVFTEADGSGKDFLAQVCVSWEEETSRFWNELSIPLATLRIGVVLARGGGALEEMVRPMRFAFGATPGSGRQWVPWIHIADVAGIMLHLLEKQEVTGTFNLTAPGHAVMSDLMKAAARSMNRFLSPFSVPSFALRAILGEQALIVVEGSRVSSARIRETGYTFQFPEIQATCDDLLK